MSAFATTDELSAYLGGDVDPISAALVLELAAGTIRAYCGWPITAVDADTAVTQGPADGGSRLALPSLYVRRVLWITVGGVTLDASAYLWLPNGDVYLARHQDWDRNATALFRPRVAPLLDPLPWPTSPGSVTVVYDHGYPVVPDGVREVCLTLASRVSANPKAVLSETIGTHSIRYGSSRTSQTVLTDLDTAVLDRYRLPSEP